ncbi:MAG: 30S ribosomal protein S20 [Firmicutes bacterium]|nr:30S ribosomal protein S20 [Bacillota bacterium]
MANIKSAIKRAKIAAEKTARNRSIKQSVKTAVKKFEAAVSGKDGGQSKDVLAEATSMLDRAVTRGVIHKNAASRKKSRLAKKLNVRTSQ